MKNKKIKVIHSCDDNPYYLDFWPLVSRVWKERIGIDPVLVHVGSSNVSDEYGEVINIKPKKYPIHIQAQLSRLWYPIHEPDVLWITSDIDMFPISRTYWKDQCNSYNFDWKNLNTNLKNYFPICYNVATGKNFKDLLSIEDDFGEFVYKVLNYFDGDSRGQLTHVPENWTQNKLSNWGVDEYYCSDMISQHRDSGKKIEQPLRPGGFHDGRRINRTNWKYDASLIKEDFYIDCHSLRPYEKYKTEIDDLLNHLI